MNTTEMDRELRQIDQEPESWFDMLNNMFDDEIEAVEIEGEYDYDDSK